MAKKQIYRLQTLFNIREKEKKAAEDFYAKQQRTLSGEEKKYAEMQQSLLDMEQRRHDKRQEYADRLKDGKLSITQIHGNDRHIDRLKNEEQAYQIDMVRQKEAIVRAEEDVEEAKELMLEATQNFKALEKHKEKWQKKVKYEEQLKVEEEVEGISQAQYFKQMQVAAEEAKKRKR